jgi:WD40 repeat protein
LSLGDDFYVNRGQLFFHNDVVVTGTSALVYRSIAPSYVAAHGCLMFDHGTTFSYAPATDNKDLIVLSDASSTLVFNESSLLATHTGLRLSKGQLFLDDKITLNSVADNKLNSVYTTTWLNYVGTTDAGISTMAWSPDGRFVAIGGFNGLCFVEVYRFDGSTLTTVDQEYYGEVIYSLAWSPDGKYLAIGGYNPTKFGGVANTNELQVYKFDGISLSPVISKDYGSWIASVAWSPDGKYLLIGGCAPISGAGGFNDTNELRLYRFDGVALVPVTSVDYVQNSPGELWICSLDWSPDGRYIAIGGRKGGSVGNELCIYGFDGSTFTLKDSETFGSYIYSIAWSPDGQSIAIGGYIPSQFGGGANTDELQVYGFDGSLLTALKSRNYGTYIRSVALSPDGRYIVIGGQTPINNISTTGFADNNELRVYRFNDRKWLDPITSYNYSTTGNIYVCRWSPDGRYIAIGGKTATGGNELWIMQCQFVNDTSTQPVDRSIIFGNSAAGSTYNLDAHVLAGARVEINGNVVDDPA